MHSLSPCLVRHLALFDLHLHLNGVKVVVRDIVCVEKMLNTF